MSVSSDEMFENNSSDKEKKSNLNELTENLETKHIDKFLLQKKNMSHEVGSLEKEKECDPETKIKLRKIKSKLFITIEKQTNDEETYFESKRDTPTVILF